MAGIACPVNAKSCIQVGRAHPNSCLLACAAHSLVLGDCARLLLLLLLAAMITAGFCRSQSPGNCWPTDLHARLPFPPYLWLAQAQKAKAA